MMMMVVVMIMIVTMEGFYVSAAHYDDFKVADASDDYRLTVGGHGGLTFT